MNPKAGFRESVDEVASVSIPGWVYTSSVTTGQYQSCVRTTGKTKYLTPRHGLAMSKRIGHTEIEVREIEQKTSSPLQDEWQGQLIIEGEKKRFSTNIDGLTAGTRCFAVYERTETLTGEPVINLHEITDILETEAKPS